MGEISYFLALSFNISKTVADTAKLLLMTNRKSYMGFRLTSRSMTLDDLELYKFEFQFSDNFFGFSRISDATTAKRMKIDQYCQRQRVSTLNRINFWNAIASHGFVNDSWASLF